MLDLSLSWSENETMSPVKLILIHRGKINSFMTLDIYQEKVMCYDIGKTRLANIKKAFHGKMFSYIKRYGIHVGTLI